MGENDGTMAVLQQLEAGQIDVSEAVQRLEATGGAGGDAGSSARRWNGWQLIPLAAGLALTAGGGWSATQGGWWWLLAAPLLIVGLPILVLAALGAESPWIRLRVRHAHGGLALAVPIPLRLVAWAVRMARPWLRGWDDVPLDELLAGLLGDLAHGGDWIVDIDDRGGVDLGAQGRPL